MLNLNQNIKSNLNVAKVLSLAVLMVILTSAANLFADGNTFYSKSGQTDPTSRDSWNTQRDGNGSKPGRDNTFTSGDIFCIQYGHSMTLSNNWTISGTGALLIIERSNNSNGTLTLDLSNTGYMSVMDLQIDGNLNVNGTGTDSLIINGGSFTRGVSSTISSSIRLTMSGSSATSTIPSISLYRLILNRSLGLNLNGNVTVSNSVILTNGVLKTGNYSLSFTNTALNTTETYLNRIDGTAIMQSRSIPTSFTFLGAYFGTGSDNLGSVSMTRTTGAAGVITNGSNNSIACNWDITAQNQPVNGKSMTYNWFSTWDYGNTFNQFNNGQVYYSTDNGASWATIGNAGNASTGTTTRAMTISTTHYSKWVVASTNSPLPVSLSSFTSSVKNNSVTLNWSTISEINNKGFEIERTEAGINDYAKVGFVDGKGTTNQVSNYSFLDSKLNSGKYSYRIKQVDFNGNFEYFSLNSGIEIGAPKKFTLSQNYPNPFNPSTKIDYEIPADSKVSIAIYDISGKEVQQIVNEYQKAGYYTAQFNASQLSSGTYFYKLSVNNTTGTEVLTKKMTLIK